MTWTSKPAWIAWDEITCKGECIRCGAELAAGYREKPDEALERHIAAHEGCTEETARLLAAERERSKIRASIERSRLIVDPSVGLALRDPVDPGTMAALVTDDRLRRSEDPAVQSALGRALVALGELHREVKRKGWTARSEPMYGVSPTLARRDGAAIPQPVGGVSIVAQTSQPGLTALILHVPGMPYNPCIDVTSDGNRVSLRIQDVERASRPLPIDPRDGSVFDSSVPLGTDSESKLRDLIRRIDAAEKERKPETYIVPIAAYGGGVQTTEQSSNTYGYPRVTYTFSLQRYHVGTARVVDIKIPESTIVETFEWGDMRICEGMDAAMLMKHCRDICRERAFRLQPGVPMKIELCDTRDPIGGVSDSLENILRKQPIQIMVEVTKMTAEQERAQRSAYDGFR